MPRPIPVILAPYNPAWPEMAAAHAERLRTLGPVLVRVHHIGSTSVPGLAAKPIIDLMPLVTTLTDLDRERSRVEAFGYRWHGEFGITERRYCTLSDEAGSRIAQLHFFAADSSQVTRHVAFRDYLRAHPEGLLHTKRKSVARATCTPMIPMPIPTKKPLGFERRKPRRCFGSPNSKPERELHQSGARRPVFFLPPSPIPV